MLTAKDFEEMWRESVVNRQKLDGCPRHDFSIDVTPELPIFKQWRCANCGGRLDAVNKLWYDIGLKHGRDNT